MPLDWAEDVENSFHESLDEQEGLVDQDHSPRYGQSLPREDSRQGFVHPQESCQSEQCDLSVSDFVQEAERLASFQDTSNSISGCSYRPQVVSDCKLGLVGVCMLQDWLQPQQGTMWSELRVIGKL